MTAGHIDLAAGRWQTLTLAEQLANIGSEVERAFRARDAGRLNRRDRALDRALELFDLTAADDRWRGPRRREILRAREQFCTALLDDDAPEAGDRGLSKYFLHFTVLARNSR